MISRAHWDRMPWHARLRYVAALRATERAVRSWGADIATTEPRTFSEQVGEQARLILATLPGDPRGADRLAKAAAEASTWVDRHRASGGDR